MNKITIHQGHVLSALKSLPDGSVHCVVTSIPYWGLRDYGLEPQVWGGEAECGHEWGDNLAAPNNKGGVNSGEKDFPGGCAHQPRPGSQSNFCRLCSAWRGSLGLEPTIELYVEHLVEIFREVKRVLRSDGTFWLNLGDSYTSTGRTDQVRSPKGTEGQDKKAPGREILWSKERHGNFSWGLPGGLKPKDLCGIPWRVALALQADGWWLRSDIIWAKPNPMPESCTDRPTRAHEYIFLLTKSAHYFFDQEAVREISQANESSQKRAQYGRYELVDGEAKRNTRTGKPDYLQAVGNDYGGGSRNLRSVWTIATEPFPGAHFATFPQALVEKCVKAGTSEKGCCPQCGAPWKRTVEKGLTAHDGQTDSAYSKGTTANRLALLRQAARERGGEYQSGNKTTGWLPTCACEAGEPIPCTVLDPFLGAGTTALVAVKLGRDAIGNDLKPEYCDMAAKRLKKDLGMLVEITLNFEP